MTVEFSSNNTVHWLPQMSQINFCLKMEKEPLSSHYTIKKKKKGISTCFQILFLFYAQQITLFSLSGE